MATLYVVAEGHAEQAFIKRMIAPYLGEYGVFAEAQRITTRDTTVYRSGTSIRQMNRGGLGAAIRQLNRGGLLSYKHLRRDIELRNQEHGQRGVWLTTFIDLYRLPEDFPDYFRCRTIADPHARASALEAAIAADLPDCRLIPYIQVHEFEALLFADLGKLELLCETDADHRALHRLMTTVAAIEPERVNGGVDTHPAERLKNVFSRGYDKVADGNDILREIGMPTLLARLPRFADWIRRLVALGAQT